MTVPLLTTKENASLKPSALKVNVLRHALSFTNQKSLAACLCQVKNCHFVFMGTSLKTNMIHEMSNLEMHEDRGSNSAAHDADYDNSDGRAAFATQSQDTMAFRWEQNTQMLKYQVKNQKIY